MFNESDREEVEEILQQQIGLVEVMIDSTLESGLIRKIAVMYKTMYDELRQVGFSPVEAMDIIKSRDLLNIKGTE